MCECEQSECPGTVLFVTVNYCTCVFLQHVLILMCVESKVFQKPYYVCLGIFSSNERDISNRLSEYFRASRVQINLKHNILSD